MSPLFSPRRFHRAGRFSVRWGRCLLCNCIDQQALSYRATILIHRHVLSVSQNGFLTETVMVSGARRLVVDVTDEGDDGIVAYAF